MRSTFWRNANTAMKHENKSFANFSIFFSEIMVIDHGISELANVFTQHSPTYKAFCHTVRRHTYKTLRVYVNCTTMRYYRRIKPKLPHSLVLLKFDCCIPSWFIEWKREITSKKKMYILLTHISPCGGFQPRYKIPCSVVRNTWFIFCLINK